MLFLGTHYRFWTKNFLAVSRKLEIAGSGSKGNKAEHATPRTVGHLQLLVCTVMPCSLALLMASHSLNSPK